jgi:hypothetical protein
MKDREKLKERIAEIIQNCTGKHKGYPEEEIAEKILKEIERG